MAFYISFAYILEFLNKLYDLYESIRNYIARKRHLIKPQNCKVKSSHITINLFKLKICLRHTKIHLTPTNYPKLYRTFKKKSSKSLVKEKSQPAFDSQQKQRATGFKRDPQ